jgi:hypothetical protein
MAQPFSFLDPPQGPSDPFGTPGLVVIDSALVLVVVGAVFVVSRCVWALSSVRHGRQKSRFMALLLAVCVLALTQIDHLGDYTHYRLPVTFILMCFAVHGLWKVKNWDPSRPE